MKHRNGKVRAENQRASVTYGPRVRQPCYCGSCLSLVLEQRVEKSLQTGVREHDPRKGVQGKRSTVAGCSERQMVMVLELPGASCPMLPH